VENLMLIFGFMFSWITRQSACIHPAQHFSFFFFCDYIFADFDSL